MASPATASLPLERGGERPPRAAARIASVAMAVPERAVRNDEVAAPLGIDPEWIVTRTGVRERRRAAGDATLVGLAAEAAQGALAGAGIEARDLDLVLVATFTQDAVLPNAAPLLAERIGASGCGALDLGAACTGFLAGLALGAAQIETERAGHVLVVGAELLSRVTDYSDRKTAGLFGDGAGAAVLGPGGTGQIGPILLRSDAGGAECITASHDERLIRMRGQDTFRAAVDRLSEATVEALAAAGLELEDVDLFAYHQANSRITRAVGERLGLEPERVIDCIERYGNTSSATVPIALCEAHREGRLQAGDTVLVATFAAGFVWGAGVIKWDGEVAT